jgi:hypothetical protein
MSQLSRIPVLPYQTTRRHFLQAGLAVAAATALPQGVSAASPNGKLRTAHIGVGGMGGADLASIASHPKVEVAALCDVDLGTLNGAGSRHPNAKKFRDFREMLSQLGDSIDAVVVSTPDHTHAPAAMTALNHNKPVYCQKPLTHEVFEARKLRTVAESKKLTTQMGIQVHSSAVYRRAVRIIQDGAIGKVSRVYAWSNKNWGFDGGPFTATADPPSNLDWNLWLGTAAQRPFTPGRSATWASTFSIRRTPRWRSPSPSGRRPPVASRPAWDIRKRTSSNTNSRRRRTRPNR